MEGELVTVLDEIEKGKKKAQKILSKTWWCKWNHYNLKSEDRRSAKDNWGSWRITHYQNWVLKQIRSRDYRVESSIGGDES